MEKPECHLSKCPDVIYRLQVHNYAGRSGWTTVWTHTDLLMLGRLSDNFHNRIVRVIPEPTTTWRCC